MPALEAEVVEELELVVGPDVPAGLGSPEELEAFEVVVAAAVGLSAVVGGSEVVAGAVTAGVVVGGVVVVASVDVVVATSVVVVAGARVVVVTRGAVVGDAVAVLAREVVVGSDEVVLAEKVAVARRRVVESVVLASTSAGAVRLLSPALPAGTGGLGIRLAVLGVPEAVVVALAGDVACGCVVGPVFLAALTTGLADLKRGVRADAGVKCPMPWAMAEAALSSVAIAATMPWPTGGPAPARCFTASAASTARERSSIFCSAAA